MEPKVTALFNDNILKQAGSLAGAPVDQLTRLGSTEAFVYEYIIGDKPRILRITHGSHRTQLQIESELHWVRRLAENGLSVSSPAPLQNGQWTEAIEAENGTFTVASFEKATGRTVRPSDWTDQFVSGWGAYTGRMHYLAVSYQIPSHILPRPQWYEEYNVTAAEDALAGQPLVLRRRRELLKYIHTLPKDTYSYGLIHGDFEDENFMLSGGQITAFDFDDLQYHWFIYEIAAIIREATWRLPRLSDNRDDELHRFIECFLTGYRKEHPLDSYWLAQLPHFLRLREVCMYTFAYGKEDVNSYNNELKAVMKQVRSNIENEIPRPNLDFSRYA